MMRNLKFSMKLMEKKSKLKDELIVALKEQNALLETRIAQLLSMMDKSPETVQKG